MRMLPPRRPRQPNRHPAAVANDSWLSTSGGGQDCSNHESANNEVAPLDLKLVGSDHTDAAKQRQDHRQLESDPEGKNELHHQGQAIFDFGQQLDCGLASACGLLHAEREARKHRPYQKINDKRAEKEEDRRGHEIGAETPAFRADKGRAQRICRVASRLNADLNVVPSRLGGGNRPCQSIS
jgi:hypothetical protein